jgi:hypothetical protein
VSRVRWVRSDLEWEERRAWLGRTELVVYALRADQGWRAIVLARGWTHSTEVRSEAGAKRVALALARRLGGGR